jgi:pre-rRNA-processing protein TSR3
MFQKKYSGIPRKLPPLLAGNPVNYSKINKLTTVEALASAAFILGNEELCSDLLAKFNWGHTFLELNENLLRDYQNAQSEDDVNSIITEYGYKKE